MNHSDKYHYENQKDQTNTELEKEVLEHDFHTFLAILVYFVAMPALALFLMRILLRLLNT